MKKYVMSIFLLSTLGMGCSQETSYIVTDIEDGDTIVIQYAGAQQRIQLAGIDAPENTENAKLKVDVMKKQLSKADILQMGEEATQFLGKQIRVGEKVTLSADMNTPDKYGRIPAMVFRDKKLLNLIMVENGYALLMTRYPLEKAFQASLGKAESDAKEQGLGLWKSSPKKMLQWSLKD